MFVFAKVIPKTLLVPFFSGHGVYGNITANHVSKLLVLNNRLLHILQCKPIKMHTADLYNTYFTLPLHLLHSYQILVFMHRYVHRRNELPVIFSTYFEEKQFIHHHDTRHKHDFHTHFVHTELGKRSIKCWIRGLFWCGGRVSK